MTILLSVFIKKTKSNHNLLFWNIIIVLYDPQQLFHDVQFSNDQAGLGTLCQTDEGKKGAVEYNDFIGRQQ